MLCIFVMKISIIEKVMRDIKHKCLCEVIEYVLILNEINQWFYISVCILCKVILYVSCERIGGGYPIISLYRVIRTSQDFPLFPVMN